MWWADTTAGQLKIRNAANDGWVVLQELDGTLLMEDGTVGAPGLAFASDLDTGFYRPAANKLGIATGGTNAVYIDNAQQVGIGTASPASQLSLGSSATAALTLVDTSVPQTIATFSQSSSGEIKIGGVNPLGTYHLAFHTQNNERARIDGTGRLLVGASTSMTTGAQAQYAKLQVVGSTASAAAQGIVSIGRGQAASSISANNDIGYINFTDNTGGEFAQIGCLVDGTCGTNDYPGILVFKTTADGASSLTERMRITNNGATTVVSFGSAGFRVNSSSSASLSSILYQGYHSATSVSTGTRSFVVYTNGNVYNTNNVYAAISDIKLKENIVDASSQWDDIKDLRVVNYNFKEGQTHTQVGLIAQEVELVSPGLVSESPDRDEEGNDLGTVTKSVNYSVLYMKAVKALQEAMERIETLEVKVAALEAA